MPRLTARKSEARLWRGEKMNEEKFCPFCGKQISEDFKICPYCGKNIYAYIDNDYNDNNSVFSQDNWLICLMLIIFLGVIGGHKFYVGRIKDGIIMLILTITVIGFPISFIIWLIDLIKLLSGNFRDSEGKYLKKI